MLRRDGCIRAALQWLQEAPGGCVERWMGEGRRRPCGEKCQAALRRGRTFPFFPLPTGMLQINAQGAVCVHHPMLEAAGGLSSSGAPG